MSIFTDTYLDKGQIILELDALEIQTDEKNKLLKVIEEIAELRFIDTILEKLDAKDKELFLEQLHNGSLEIATEVLRERIENLEELLRGRAKAVEREILQDIKTIGERK